MHKLNENYTSIDRMAGQFLQRKTATGRENSSQTEVSFQQILDTAEQKQDAGRLKFSKHANERLARRNINLSETQMERLESGTTKAREKGIQESLIMVDDLAFIVNVKNNTVITAVGDSTDSIFTNIDGAVIS